MPPKKKSYERSRRDDSQERGRGEGKRKRRKENDPQKKRRRAIRRPRRADNNQSSRFRKDASPSNNPRESNSVSQNKKVPCAKLAIIGDKEWMRVKEYIYDSPATFEVKSFKELTDDINKSNMLVTFLQRHPEYVYVVAPTFNTEVEDEEGEMMAFTVATRTIFKTLMDLAPDTYMPKDFVMTGKVIMALPINKSLKLEDKPVQALVDKLNKVKEKMNTVFKDKSLSSESLAYISVNQLLVGIAELGRDDPIAKPLVQLHQQGQLSEYGSLADTYNKHDIINCLFTPDATIQTVALEAMVEKGVNNGNTKKVNLEQGSMTGYKVQTYSSPQKLPYYTNTLVAPSIYCPAENFSNMTPLERAAMNSVAHKKHQQPTTDPDMGRHISYEVQKALEGYKHAIEGRFQEQERKITTLETNINSCVSSNSNFNLRLSTCEAKQKELQEKMDKNIFCNPTASDEFKKELDHLKRDLESTNREHDILKKEIDLNKKEINMDETYLRHKDKTTTPEYNDPALVIDDMVTSNDEQGQWQSVDPKEAIPGPSYEHM
jgi:hypothetical protein